MKRVLVSILAVCIILSLAGCKDKDKSKSESDVTVSEISSESNGTDDDSNDSGGASSDSEDSEDKNKLVMIPLVSTRLSWEIPGTIEISQTENGFAGKNEDDTIGLLCRRENLFKLHESYESGARVSEDILKSRLYEFAFGDESYTITDTSLFKVQVDGQTGFWFKADYSMGNYDGKLQALSIQFDDDIVVLAAVYDGMESSTVDAIFNSVGAHKEIFTEWDIQK